MPVDPRIRASDQDRDSTADMLREHHAVGRLDAAEFQDRLDKVFEAKTIGDLDELTADLPAIDLYPLPTASLPRNLRPPNIGPTGSVGLPHRRGRLSGAWHAAWGSWLSVTMLLTVIWVLSGAGYPWPLWVVGPWGAVMAGRWIVGSGHGGSDRGKLGQHPHQDEIGGSDDGR